MGPAAQTHLGEILVWKLGNVGKPVQLGAYGLQRLVAETHGFGSTPLVGGTLTVEALGSQE